MLALRLAFRALLWRAGASATVFAVALIGITAAALGPIYLHAVDETVLAERLTQAPQDQRDLRISRQTLIGLTEFDQHSAIAGLAQDGYHARWFDKPVFSEEAQIVFGGITRYSTQFAAIDDLCAHVRVVSGRCLADSTAAETLVTLRTARTQHLTVGQLLAPVPVANVTPIEVRVVGIVTPIRPHGAFWSPWNYFNAGPSLFDRQLPRLDSFLVSHSLLSKHVIDTAQTVAANLRLRADNIRLDDLPALRADIKTVEDAATTTHTSGDSLSLPTVGSELPNVLDAMDKEMSLARTLIILPTAQLVLLAIFVLYAVVAGTTAVQGHEVALAKLRGRRTGRILFQGVAQPIMLVLVAAPIAAALAWLVVSLVADHLLSTSVSIAFPASAALVVAATTGASILAAVVAARRIVVSPVGQLLRKGTDSSNASLGLALADAATVTLALAGLVELIATGTLDSGKPNPLSALAPPLLGVALAVVALRLLPYAGRAVVRWTSESTHLAGYLAVRQIVRRPAGARVVVLIGVALSLASFAVINWSVAGTNREARAVNQAGAPTVYEVAPGEHVYDLRTAVDKADPGGHSMAAAVVQATGSTPLIAVDTDRFDGVGAWQSGYSSTSLPAVLRELASPAAKSLSISGDQLRLEVDLTKAPPRRPVTLSVAVTGVNHRRESIDFGTIHAGTGVYTEALNPICLTACRITGLSLRADAPVTAPPATKAAAIDVGVSAATLTSGAARPVDGFGDPARWRDDAQSIVRLARGHAALQVALRQTSPDGPFAELLSADSPSHVPAVLASETASSYPGPAIHDASAFGLDSQNISLDGVATSVSLPRLDRSGVMIDFGAALNAMIAPVDLQTQLEVWAGPGAPGDLPARLAAQGVKVIATVHASTYRAVLDRTGPAFADGLFLVAAVAAILLAIGATVLAGVITARRRAYELAALEAAGVPRRTLRRSAAVEQGILLTVATVVGLAAGVVGSVLALPSTPFFVDQTIGPPVEHGLPWALLAMLVLLLVVVFSATSVLVARVVARQATAARLREAQA
ncbi:MAG: FtsX-like permease family protein [Jatrophihabitantaceae bacterium]